MVTRILLYYPSCVYKLKLSQKNKVYFKYVAFAVIATVVNLLVQMLSLRLYFTDYSLLLAMFLGTAIGLVIKFLLDKYYIFDSKKHNAKQNLKEFCFYSITGVLTTLLFWSVEWFFDYYISMNWAKYLGAVVGLTLGYIIKFYLDKKYVFKVLTNVR